MKRVSIVVVGCFVALVVGAQAASAEVLKKTVVTCQTGATWQLTRGGTASALVTLDATDATGCTNVNAEIEDDLNFLLRSYDYAYPGLTIGFDLVGAIVTGAPQFAGVATAGGRVYGPVAVANAESLTATLSGLSLAGGNIVQEHLPAGGCGTECYRTSVTLTGIWDF